MPEFFEEECEEVDGVKECRFDDGEWACTQRFEDGFHPTYEACTSADGSEGFVCEREDEVISCEYTFEGETCEEVFTPWEMISSTCEDNMEDEVEDTEEPAEVEL